ncbi:porin family protein [Flavobacterium sp.]|uniref:porin family protein n=1 Tax=Flavobacterium sp. TaxID=239 RepID=UPI0039E378DF
MKKILMAILLASQFGLAQKGKFEFGLVGGYNTASVSSIQAPFSDQDVSSRAGVNIGLSSEYHFAENWSVNLKVLYDQKGLDGYNVSFDLTPESGYNQFGSFSDFDLKYLTFPVTAHWNFGKKVNFSIGAGGYVGYLLDSNADDINRISFDPLDLNGNSTLNPLDFEEMDYGAVVSAGAKYPLTEAFRIGFEYEFQQGFSEVLQPNIYRDKHTNSRHSFNLGVYYRL